MECEIEAYCLLLLIGYAYFNTFEDWDFSQEPLKYLSSPAITDKILCCFSLTVSHCWVTAKPKNLNQQNHAPKKDLSRVMLRESSILTHCLGSDYNNGELKKKL